MACRSGTRLMTMTMDLHDFDVDGFLQQSWQKKPLLIRNPWTSWHNPLEPDELAGLACENEVESRLIVQGTRNWELEHGPFAEDRFGRLGADPWTLLVQAVDHHVPAVAALLQPFRFIPLWRIDDVMVSYAAEGGGVGPHFDQYDVFLVQGLGKRRWQLGGQCDDTTELLPHPDLRLLAGFEPLAEWILEPGDILYVPPGFAHNGIAASDDCMSYSIGFRAPSRRELIANWSESLAADLDDDDRYSDPNLSAQENPGEITPAAIDRLHGMITERMLDRGAFARWFGQYSTAPKNPEMDWRPEEPVDAHRAHLLLAEGVTLLRNPASRFSFTREGADSVSLFIDGECFACAGEAAAFAELVCAQDRVMPGLDMIASALMMDLVVTLLNRGSIAFDLED
jgi:50S ribosomal protein L16 3-hydroxylase